MIEDPQFKNHRRGQDLICPGCGLVVHPRDTTVLRDGFVLHLACGSAESSLTGITVLVVEDHSDSRFVLEETLHHMGAVVMTAPTAKEALAFIASANIILTDFAMPGEDGAWLLDQVNKSARPIPVILLSGFAPSQLPAVALAPFRRKLLKPIDPWDLAREILAVLGPGPQRPGPLN